MGKTPSHPLLEEQKKSKRPTSITTSTIVFISISFSRQAHRKNSFSRLTKSQILSPHQELLMCPGGLEVWDFFSPPFSPHFFTHKGLNSFPKPKLKKPTHRSDPKTIRHTQNVQKHPLSHSNPFQTPKEKKKTWSLIKILMNYHHSEIKKVTIFLQATKSVNIISSSWINSISNWSTVN